MQQAEITQLGIKMAELLNKDYGFTGASFGSISISMLLEEALSSLSYTITRGKHRWAHRQEEVTEENPVTDEG